MEFSEARCNLIDTTMGQSMMQQFGLGFMFHQFMAKGDADSTCAVTSTVSVSLCQRVSYSPHLWNVVHFWYQKRKFSKLQHTAAFFFLPLTCFYNCSTDMILLQSQEPETRNRVQKGQENHLVGLFWIKDRSEYSEQSTFPTLTKHFCAWEL